MNKASMLLDNRMPAPRDSGFRMDGYWIWCGSVVKGEDNKYHMFASRWPKHLTMHPGWLVGSEVVRAVSGTPEGPYEFQEVVLPARGPQYWDGRSTHNPSIMKHDDKYILYYMGSTHPFPEEQVTKELEMSNPIVVVARTNKRIGIATADSVYGPWKRLDKPIMETRPDKFDSLLVSNPAPWINEDGSVNVIYKSRPYLKEPKDGFYHGDMSLSIAGAHKYDQPHTALKDEPILDLGDRIIEDPFMWRDNEGYHLIAKDMSGKICGEVNDGMYAHSKDGINWDVVEGAKSYSRTITWDDGSEQVMGQLERPFILFEDGVPTHMFFATADGVGGFQNASETWNMVVPLKLS